MTLLMERITILGALTRSPLHIHGTACSRISDSCKVRCGELVHESYRILDMSLMGRRTMAIIHADSILLENIYVNSTDTEHTVGFDFSSLNVSLSLILDR